MNNKGFTVVELIAAFSVTMVISVFLFELLIEVKDIFIETSLKTNIEEKTAIISKNINNLLNDTSNIVNCSSNTNCTINGKSISVLQNNDKKQKDYIIIGNQKFAMPKDGDNYVKITGVDFTNDSQLTYIKISFDLTSDNLAKPYEYNVVFYYN
ncbi:MAG: hypothetical protein IKF91_00155 [Bacilli bacterium]|nr:hypothetical protein [Bacilli bacterium]